MTTPPQDAPLVLPSVVFRPLRLLAVCVALAAVATLAAGLLGHPIVGVFFGIGLALGLLNAILVQRSVAAITAKDHPLKRKVALNSATRLLMKPTHLAGGYAQLSYAFNYLGPTGNQRDMVSTIRKRSQEVVY